MSDIDGQGNDIAELRDELSRIEGEPIDSRAVEYARLHDQLQTRLSGADVIGNNV
jgi:hypothetical protein